MTERAVPRAGPMEWRCWCGETAIVSGDVDDNYGWDRVAAHRAEHKTAKAREKRVEKRNGGAPA